MQLPAIPPLLYISYTFFVTAYQELFVKRKITMALVDVLDIGGMLASINLFAASLTSVLTILSFKIIHRVKDNSQRSLVRVFNQHLTTVWLLIDETEIEQAKALLAEAGYPAGLEVTLYASPAVPNSVEMGVAFQEMAREAGITVNVERIAGQIFTAPAHPYTRSLLAAMGGQQD